MTRAFFAFTLVFAALSGVACSDRVQGKSTGTNWLDCNTDADCSRVPGARCREDRVCVDRNGDPISRSFAPDGGQVGSGGAGGGIDDGATGGSPSAESGGRQSSNGESKPPGGTDGGQSKPSDGAGSGGDAASCAITRDTAKISIVSSGVEELDCDSPDASSKASTFTHVGVAHAVTATSFELECTEGRCSTPSVTIGVDAPGLDLTRSVREGATVRVTDRVSYFFACITGIAVEAVTGAGDAGTPTEPALLFAVGEGAEPPTDVVKVTFEKIGCSYPWSDKSCGQDDGTVGIYSMTASADFLAEPLTARMGQTAESTITGSARVLREHDLRSYQSDACDDYWNWAGWVAIESDE